MLQRRFAWTAVRLGTAERVSASFNCATRKRIAVRRHSSSQVGARSSKVIFSGIQPTGVPHIGNYLGALKQWVKLQNEAEEDTVLIYSLVDLHALTIRQDPQQLRQWKRESLAMLLAIGLDPKRSTIFHQSDVTAHAELMWILSCFASTGYLGRMTQWKEKTAGEREDSERLKLGLFSYPVLQAADILLYRSTHVPVGQDQSQHLEFARTLANSFSHQYGKGTLLAPESIISPAKRILSLTDPTAKMSKSHANPKSRILLTDDDEAIAQKVKAAVTDSIPAIEYDPVNRPGVSNLLDILYYFEPNTDSMTKADLTKEMAGISIRHFKDRVTIALQSAMSPFRERFNEYSHNDKYLDQVAAEGAEKARQRAAITMDAVKEEVGLL
jgi:tryptophanyl-tRNA synthetase